MDTDFFLNIEHFSLQSWLFVHRKNVFYATESSYKVKIFKNYICVDVTNGALAIHRDVAACLARANCCFVFDMMTLNFHPSWSSVHTQESLFIFWLHRLFQKNRLTTHAQNHLLWYLQ